MNTTTTIPTTAPTTTQQLVTLDIPVNARWVQNGVTVAGGNVTSDLTFQLYHPHSVVVVDDQTIIISDQYNHRIIQWKIDDINGRVVAGSRGQGTRLDQLDAPTYVVIDRETDSLIICDRWDKRVVRWSRRRGTAQGEVLLDMIDCFGLVMDDKRYLYISDVKYHAVRRYQIGEKYGILVAGGHGMGNGLNQFNEPTFIFVDQQQAVYVSDHRNHRVMKWNKGATEGIVVAGSHTEGEALTQV
ncbi:unnamed protein product [Rotaria sp. Silwood2]|nr:unnamed protein product [Rotaria sp. Silwood2]